MSSDVVLACSSLYFSSFRLKLSSSFANWALLFVWKIILKHKRKIELAFTNLIIMHQSLAKATTYITQHIFPLTTCITANSSSSSWSLSCLFCATALDAATLSDSQAAIKSWSNCPLDWTFYSKIVKNELSLTTISKLGILYIFVLIFI